MKKIRNFNIGTGILILFFTVTVAVFNFHTAGSDQWQGLARSFLSGKPFFIQSPSSIDDSVFLNGHFYWPFAPFPAVLLMPFVFFADLFKVNLSQAPIQFLLVAGTFLLIYRLARKFFIPDDAAWIAIAFCFASAFLWTALMPFYVYLPYIIADFALFAALLEYTGKKRWWLIGALMAIALTSRTTAGLGIFFFLGDIIFIEKEALQKKISSAWKLLAPFVLAVVALCIYNYVRFADPFQTGYSLQIILDPAFSKARAYGLFSLVHIPGNLYYFLFNGPMPILKDGLSRVLSFPYIKADPWGMGLVFVSPYLCYLFCLSYKDKISKLLIGTSVLIAIPIFMYYGIGFAQVGDHYALDFMPFIYFLFMRNYSMQYGALSTRLKWLIALSALFDLFLCLTLIAYPSLP